MEPKFKMTSTAGVVPKPQAMLADVCSFEITAKDASSLDGASEFLRRDTELFVANVANDGMAKLVEACASVQRVGFMPVPHIVARNIASQDEFDTLLTRLAGEAGVTSVLLLGGDRAAPAGPFASALDLLQTGLIGRRGIGRVYFACYPERHPRIPADILNGALTQKLSVAHRDGLEAALISQFAFQAEPILVMARGLRRSGASVPLHVGLAGPIGHAKLLRYALRCGIGPSIRILHERKGLALSMLAGESPDGLFAELAAAQAAEPSLGLGGIHLFTFGTLARSAQWARAKQSA